MVARGCGQGVRVRSLVGRSVLALLAALAVGAASRAAAQAPIPPLPLVVHVALVDGHPVVDEAWVRQQVDAANALFAPHGLAVRLARVEPLVTPPLARIESREERDSLGAALAAGVVNVFIVAGLADIDGPGDRRGVHWRVRRGRGRHLVIVAESGGGTTLAHELGHFFGLPHSHVVNDLMSYDRTGAPFLSDEQGARMREHARAFLRSRELAAGP